MKNIFVFYKKQQYFHKLILTGIFFICINLILTFYVFKKGLKAEDHRLLHSFHLNFQNFLGKNLFNNCQGFLTRDILEYYKQEYLSHQFDFDLVETKNFSVGELEFYDLILRSYSNKNSNLEVYSKGYLVKLKETSRCFGVM